MNVSISDLPGVAQQLASRFLRDGNYYFAPHTLSTGGGGAGVVPASTGFGEGGFDETGFAGLAVQAVGYEYGGDDPKLHVYVINGPKKTEREIGFLGGTFRVQITRVGKVTVRPDQSAAAVHRGRYYRHGKRVACGSSCAPSSEAIAGTLGALVRKSGEEALFALSNNHVFGGCNHTAPGTPILSPSSLDTYANGPAPNEIARHSALAELRSGDPTQICPCEEDVAIARVTDANLVSSMQGEGTGRYDTPTSYGELQSGLRVKKFGRTTGLTRGTLQAYLNTPLPIPYKAKNFNAVVWQVNAWTIVADPDSAFALPGDSGSVVVTEDGRFAVGLIFAASRGGDVAYITPMDRVLSRFGGLQLVNAHGL
jgi:hypothetical protein